MARLVVKDFSCIKEADLEIANFTIIMGEQASGKSLLAKLVYFFQNSVNIQIGYFIAKGKSISELKERTISFFQDLFPSTAWGQKNFSIRFESGDLSISIKRNNNAGIKVIFSDNIVKNYNYTLQDLIKFNKDNNTLKKDSALFELDNLLSGYDFSNKFLNKLGVKSLQNKFIPAGRAYFTSMVKSFELFENAESIDPFIVSFGKYYAFLYDARKHYKNSGALKDEYDNYQKKEENQRKIIENKILGGNIGSGKDLGYIVTKDNRRVPFAFASSGQQELIPLLETLYLENNNEDKLIFIEEPEAHLFPQAQADLVGYIASFVTNKKMFITTHSPYILSQINNLIKAGALAEKAKPAVKKKIEQIVPKSAWLKNGVVMAYTIKDGVLENGMDEETGLINAELIDGASEQISEQFSKLLDIEFPDV